MAKPGETVEPQIIAAEPPPPASPGTVEPQTIAAEPPPFAPSPVAEVQQPRAMRIGRARAQAVDRAARTRRRRLARTVLAGLAVIALLVVAGGQVLGPRLSGRMPGPTDIAGALPTATPEPTGSATPTRTGDIPTQSPLPTATLGGPSPTPLATPLVYVVQRGDTMSKIAEQFGVTLADLVAANPQIEDPSLIYAGNIITIPTSGLAPGASPTASAVP